RGVTVGVERVEIRAVGPRGEHAGGERDTAVRLTDAPTMEKAEAACVRGKEQVVEPVTGPGPGGAVVGDFCGFGEGHDDVGLAGLEADAPDARVLRDLHTGIAIGDSGVAVAWAPIVQAAEIGGERPLAVGT